MRRPFVAIAMLLAYVTPSGAAAPQNPGAVTFQPHRAIYDFALLKAASGSSVAGLTGRMVYELNGSTCEGYTQNMRFVTVTTNEDGSENVNDLRNSSWEDAIGDKLRFSFTQLQNDQLADVAQGDATRKKDGDPIGIAIKKPAKKNATLPSETYFPMHHAAMLIDHARRGDTLFKGYLFDGSEKGEKYYLTSAVIGRKIGNGAASLPAAFKNPGRLDGVASWPVAISYFEPGNEHQDSTPNYELSFRYFENGVTADLTIDYGEFAIRGTLSDLTYLDAAKCGTDAN